MPCVPDVLLNYLEFLEIFVLSALWNPLPKYFPHKKFFMSHEALSKFADYRNHDIARKSIR